MVSARGNAMKDVVTNIRTVKATRLALHVVAERGVNVVTAQNALQTLEDCRLQS
jgi:hypothetical protein